MGKFIFACLLLLPHLVRAQAPVYFEKGKSYYDNNQYREALYYLNRYLALDSSRAEVYKWRGNCYTEFNHLDSALLDYNKALSLDPTMSEVNYNIGLVYAQKNLEPEALIHVRKYLRAKPDDAEAVFLFGRLLLNTRQDSGLYYLEKAYRLDPEEIRITDVLSSEYLNQRKYTEAYDLTKQGRKMFPHHFELLIYQAYAAFATGRFKECADLSDTLYRNHDDLGFKVLKIKSNILANTKKETFEQNGFSIRFKHISSYQTNNLDQWVIDPASPYYYNELLQRYRNHEPLGLDEYFMVYYGFTSDSRYSPYFSDEKSIKDLFQDGKFQEAIDESKKLLSKDEFNPRLTEYLFVALRESEQEFEPELTKYLALMESILATGDGQSYESAIVVTSPSHEYDLLNYMGYRSRGQSLYHYENHIFDVLKASNENEERDLYFNIDKPFRSLGKTFRESDNTKSGKRKKNSKKKMIHYG